MVFIFLAYFTLYNGQADSLPLSHFYFYPKATHTRILWSQDSILGDTKSDSQWPEMSIHAKTLTLQLKNKVLKVYFKAVIKF